MRIQIRSISWWTILFVSFLAVSKFSSGNTSANLSDTYEIQSGYIQQNKRFENNNPGLSCVALYMLLSAGFIIVLEILKRNSKSFFSKQLATDRYDKKRGSESPKRGNVLLEKGLAPNISGSLGAVLPLPQADCVRESSLIVAVRKELFGEINIQITHWVMCESAQLSSRLDELTERINQLEKDSEPEIDSIKQEAMRISREIEIYRTHLVSS